MTNDNKNYKKHFMVAMIFFLATVATNYLSAMGYIRGNSQSEVSKAFPTMLTPAGFAFSIWGIIYLFIFLALLSVLIAPNEKNRERLQSTMVLFSISAIVNISWTIVFSSKQIGLSVLLILALLVCIYKIVVTLRTISPQKNSLFDIGFGLYAGWLSIASLVNFLAFLTSIQVDFGENAKLIHIGLLIVFSIVIVILQQKHHNPFYNLSIIWAFFGIIQKTKFEQYTDPLFLTLAAGMLVLLLVDGKDIYNRKIQTND